MMRFGKSNGHVDDYGHCDLVWSRHAPQEIFPPLIDWLDQRQPGVGPSPQAVSPLYRRARSQPVLRNESMQICDQVSNSSRRPQTVASGRNSASASPSSRGTTCGCSSSKRCTTPRWTCPTGVESSLISPTRRIRPGLVDVDFLVDLAPHRRLRRRRGSCRPAHLLRRRDPPTPSDRSRCSLASPCDLPRV